MCLNPTYAFCIPNAQKSKQNPNKRVKKLAYVKYPAGNCPWQISKPPISDKTALENYFNQRIDIQKAIYEKELHNYPSGTEVIHLPCGKCRPCRLKHASQWQERLLHELHVFPDAIFITLTYDEENLESDSLNRDDVQKFIKNVRRNYQGIKFVTTPSGKLDNPIRYLGAAEYGSKNHRPHFHIILFNLQIWDKVPDEVQSKSQTGEEQFTSKTLTRLWGKGRVNFGSVTPESCGYVARYTTKKADIDEEEYLSRNDIKETIDPETGELNICEIITKVAPEFLFCSTKPGIGWYFYQKYKQQIHVDRSGIGSIKTKTKNQYGFESASKTISAGSNSAPRYYDKLLAKESEQALETVKKSRKYQAQAKEFANPEEFKSSRMMTKYLINDLKTQRLKRHL